MILQISPQDVDVLDRFPFFVGRKTTASNPYQQELTQKKLEKNGYGYQTKLPNKIKELRNPKVLMLLLQGEFFQVVDGRTFMKNIDVD